MNFVVLIKLTFLLCSVQGLTGSEEMDVSEEYEDFLTDEDMNNLSGTIAYDSNGRSFVQPKWTINKNVEEYEDHLIDRMENLSETTLHDDSKRRVLRRFSRSTFESLTKQYVPAVENIIIANCQSNNQSEAAEKLQHTFEDMKACLRKKKIFATPRDEFLATIEECSKEPMKESKECLAENQRYFPDLILDLGRSVTQFLYNDFDIIRVDMVKCYPKLANSKALYNYKQCLVEVELRAPGSHLIPPTKTEFCEKFIPGAYCFTNMVKENCERTPGLAKYREDYIRSHKEPCEAKINI